MADDLDPNADLGAKLYPSMAKPTPVPDFARAEYPSMLEQPAPRPPTREERREDAQLQQLYPSMFAAADGEQGEPSENTDSAPGDGPEIGVPNKAWTPDFKELEVDAADVDHESLDILRGAPVSDAVRHGIASAWAAAHRAEPQTIEQGMAALRGHFRTDAALRQGIADAQLALTRAPAHIREALDQTQAGNNPDLIKALARAGRALRSRR